VVIWFRYGELWFYKFLSFFIGCWLCLNLQSHLGWGPVISAALVGFLGSFFPENRKIHSAHIQANIYIGAFVGMGSKALSTNSVHIALIALLGSLLYFLLTPYFKGLGGKLGMIAFVSSLLSFVMSILQ
jgi:hypothetical protein